MKSYVAAQFLTKPIYAVLRLGAHCFAATLCVRGMPACIEEASCVLR